MQTIYSAGNRVVHATYGDGTVTSVNEYHTVVDFDAHGSRTFATPLVQLESSTVPAPPKAVKTRRRVARKTDSPAKATV